jgi:hypothetical protein
MSRTCRHIPEAAHPNGRALRLQGLPASEEPFAGGPWFVAYCLGAEPRASHRRSCIKRVRSALRRAESKGDDPYPAALVLAQRMGIALEDLGRLAIALEAARRGDAFDAFRAARLDEVGSALARLRSEDALRGALNLPSRSGTQDLAPDLQEAALAASDALAKRWTRQWRSCAAGWPLLSRIAKGARHGSPLVKRDVILTPPGAGALGANASDDYERWLLLVNTDVDENTKHIQTEWAVADLSKKTLARAEAAALDGIALAQQIALTHSKRVQSVSRWAFPNEIIRALPQPHRRILERHRR